MGSIFFREKYAVISLLASFVLQYSQSAQSLNNAPAKAGMRLRLQEGLGFVFIQIEPPTLRLRVFGSVFLLRFSFVIIAFHFLQIQQSTRKFHKSRLLSYESNGGGEPQNHMEVNEMLYLFSRERGLCIS